MAQDSEHVYRAVVSVDGAVSVYGPYATQGAASTAISRERGDYWNRGKEVAGYVECLSGPWERIY
jgi:hypothetical protein